MSDVTIVRGYRRIVVAPVLLVEMIQHGTRSSDPLDVIPDDLEIVDARFNGWVHDYLNPGIELLVSSTTFQEVGELLHITERWKAPTWTLTYRTKDGPPCK